MKKSNLFILALAAPTLLTGITSCNNQTHKVNHEKFVDSTSGLDFLYEVTYHDYSWSDVTKWMNSQKNVNSHQGGFGCSSIHYGNYYGRSFDFCITQMEEFLVRTKHENGHYASLGVAIADCNMNKENVENINDGKGDETDLLNEKMLPFTMVDGINENGVVCNTNVVPAKDLIPHEGEEKYHTRGTNPGKPDLFYQFMPRFILDNAKSAEHAVELLKNRNLTAVNKNGNVCDYLGVSKMGYELHCMIADKDDTYVIEMMDDYMNIIHSGSNVMTNYYLTNQSPSGAGLERYDLLFNDLLSWQNGKATCDLKAMKETIQKVQYSPCYDPKWDGDGTTNAKWPTEFAGCDIINEEGAQEKLTFYNASKWCEDNWTKDAKLQDQLNKVYNEQVLQQLKNPSKRPLKLKEGLPWISTHAEVYDIENKTLHLVTQEKGKTETDSSYDFKEFKL